MKIIFFLCLSIVSVCLCVPTDSKKGKAEWKTLNDGNKMPSYGFGTAEGYSLKYKEFSDSQKPTEDAIDAGYRLFDTAESYHNEDDVGKAIEKKIKEGVITREDVFVVTKLGNLHHGKDQVVPTLRESLKKLKLDYVDLYLIHTPAAVNDDQSFNEIDYVETWEGMEECKKLGLAKSIGLSNFNISQMERIFQHGKVKPAVLEIEVNPTLTQYKLTKFCKENNIAVIAYAPFGFMTRKVADAPPPKFDDPILTEIAKSHNKKTGQVVLRYLVDRGLIPIPKSSTTSRIQENFDIFDFHLTPEEIEKIDKFNKDKRVYDAAHGKAHKFYPF